MFATAIIVFREVLEAALIISIVMAASRGARHRGAWVWGGVVAGLLLSCLVALFAGNLAEALEGAGQELFNAAILLVAVVMLGWHNIWMQQHGREIAQEMSQVGREVVSGSRPLHALALVVGLAVLREGSELVLFLFGLASAEDGGASAMLFGGGLGLLLGASVGFILYFGLARIPMHYFFRVTGWMILFLAAGLASQAAAFLVQADWLPPVGRTVWDTSAILPEDGLLGQLLHALVGYVAQPDGIQLIFYAFTFLVIGGLMRGLDQASRVTPPPSR